MEYQIQARPAFSYLDVNLNPGEQIVAESGAMAWMEGPIATKTSTRGGVMGGLKRKLLSGESFFQNTYTAEGGAGTVTLAPGAAGDLVATELHGALNMQKGAYLASTTGVKCDSKWSGFKGFFNEGLFILRVEGDGMLFFGSYGAIEEVQVDGTFVVDNGFAVAWDPTLDFRLTKARKIRSFLFSDQILCEYSGTGRLWIQTRTAHQLASAVYPYRPVDSD